MARSPARLLWLIAALGSAATAQPRSLAVRHLTPADGLRRVVVSALTDEADGFVWVGTPGGPDRFDGVRFGPLGVAPQSPLRALATTADGALWLGTDAGLARWDGGRPMPVAGVTAGVRALRADGDSVWAATTGGGLLRLGPGRGGRRWRGGALPSDTVRAVVRHRGGVVAATAGGLRRLGGATSGLRDVTALADVGGTVWAGRDDGTLVALDAALAPVGEPVVVQAAVSALVPSAAYPGWAWVGTRGGGLWLLDGRSGRAHHVALVRGEAPVSRVEVLAVHESRGALWIGTTDGLFQADVTPPRFTTVRHDPDRPDGLRTENVMSVHASRRDPGVVWVGTVRGGLHRVDRATGTAEVWFGDPQHPLSVPFAIHEMPDGTVWVGGDALSLFRFVPGTGALREIPLASGDGYVTAIVPARADGLWVTTSAGGVVRVDREARRAKAVDLGVGGVIVWRVVEPADEPGVLYATTQGAGLIRLDVATGAARRVDPACDLDDRLVGLAAGPEGALWVGSFENRLARIDRRTGACRLYDAADGLPDESVGGIALDARGRVWVTTMAGLARFDPEAEVFTRFSAADGLPDGALYFHALDHSPDGELLLGGADGFTAFHPDAVPIDATPAPVRITGVRVDGEPVPLAAALGGLVLRHDRNDLAVNFAALDLRQPEKTRYRVWLVGADDGWRPSGPEVRYPLLPSGRYTLRVAASNRDGYWSAPAALAVRIRPPYWRTPWFWALVAMAAGGLGLAAHRVRVEQLLRVERTRRQIADDLHDDIGSKIASVALRLDVAAAAPGVPADVRARLGRLGETARGVVADLRDTVWLVDAGHDDLRAVADRMEQFARQALEGGRGAVARGEVPAFPLGMAARRDLYLLFTEALHNAVRHAHAAHVTVEIGMDAGAFRVAVADDGRGFDPQAASAGRGMGTMRRRADVLGGTLTVASAPGQGTRVAFRLPVGGRRLV